MSTKTEPDWEAGPARPLLAEGAVHVWRAELDGTGETREELLDAGERARAERLLNARDRRRWTRARMVLRALLGLYLERDPRLLRFSEGTHGKPALDPPAISFNLSHSDGLALYALAATGAVGVDVERRRRERDVLALAQRFLGAGEVARLRTLGAEPRQREFLRSWVRHEAALKRLGLGIGTPVPAGAPKPWIAELDLGADASAALALDRAPAELCCWRWTGAPGR